MRDANLARGNAEQVRAMRLRKFQRLVPYLNHQVLAERPALLLKLAETLTRSQPSAARSKTPKKGTAIAGTPTQISRIIDGRDLVLTRMTVEGGRRVIDSDVVVPDDASVDQLKETLADLSMIDAGLRPSAPELAQNLESLLDSYTKGLRSDPAVILPVVSPALPSPEADPEVSVSLTRSQLSIASAEDQIWASLSASLAIPSCGDETQSTALAALQSHIGDLALQSEVLSHSYRRTAELPGEETFNEVKMMIEAMGVPWTESTGDIEAEALASGIVKSGRGDYVASEDTVRQNL